MNKRFSGTIRKARKIIPLKSIHWSGVVEGPLFKYQSVQNYENNTEDTIEISYSFPLPYGKSVITRFTAEINGVVREARALPKKKAKESYEDAMGSGDSPVMLEIEEKDFCNASLGNLKPGEKAIITVEYLQLLEFHGKKARITIPTVLDGRFAADARNYPSELMGANANIFADYACAGELVVKKPFDTGVVSSPTHTIKCSHGEEGLKVLLTGKADRDFVVDLEVESTGVLCLAKDGSEWAALASFIPQVKHEEQALDLTILVDCSGSMGGSRIEWAKQALLKISQDFKPLDQVSLFKFGSTTELVKVPITTPWDEKFAGQVKKFKKSWTETISSIDADLGGTELAEALEESSKPFPGGKENSALLLITDGEVWDKSEVLKAAKKSERRIFTLGIGMAPYSNLLSEIAGATGGIYESVYNYTDIEGAVESVISRLRTPMLTSVKVHWPKDAIWNSQGPRKAYGSDSYTSAAFLKEPIEELSMNYCVGEEKHRDTVLRLKEESVAGLAQLVANIKMVSSKDAGEQEFLGIKYNLAGPQTNFLLVVEREEKDKPADLAKLSIVPQMLVPDRVEISPMNFMRTRPSDGFSAPRRMASRAFHEVKTSLSPFAADDIEDDEETRKEEEWRDSWLRLSSCLASSAHNIEEYLKSLQNEKSKELLSEYWSAINSESEAERYLLLQDVRCSSDEFASLDIDVVEFLKDVQKYLTEEEASIEAFHSLLKQDSKLRQTQLNFSDFCRLMKEEHKDWLDEKVAVQEKNYLNKSPKLRRFMLGESTGKDLQKRLERAITNELMTVLFFVFFVLGYENFLEAKN